MSAAWAPGAVSRCFWLGKKDPLFLQIKETRASVLERYAGKSAFPNHGERVVNGCRLMQSESDLFLGWTVGPGGRHFYLRQLEDVRITILVERDHKLHLKAVRDGRLKVVIGGDQKQEK